jgi:hypothetical protein
MLNELQLSNEFAVTSSAAASRRWRSSDELKAIVRDGLILMDQPEREQLIRDLAGEMKVAGLTMSSHLLMIGIPATDLSELTPNEVGHFVRFIEMTAPRFMPAIERVLARYIAFWRKEPLRLEELLQPAA